MMALHVGPRRAKTLAGVIGLSGMLADPDALTAEVVIKPPILLVHGDCDEVLPVESLHQAEVQLTGLGFDVSSHVSPGLRHSIDEPGLQLCGNWRGPLRDGVAPDADIGIRPNSGPSPPG
jgi:phospholipase/carboxylesterase